MSLPGIARVIAVAILFRALDAFKIFDLVYMFTQGGPGTSTESISWYIYQLGFKFFRLGYASAVSFIVVILLTVVATLYVARFVRGARRMSAATSHAAHADAPGRAGAALPSGATRGARCARRRATPCC